MSLESEECSETSPSCMISISSNATPEKPYVFVTAASTSTCGFKLHKREVSASSDVGCAMFERAISQNTASESSKRITRVSTVDMKSHGISEQKKDMNHTRVVDSHQVCGRRVYLATATPNSESPQSGLRSRESCIIQQPAVPDYGETPEDGMGKLPADIIWCRRAVTCSPIWHDLM